MRQLSIGTLTVDVSDEYVSWFDNLYIHASGTPNDTFTLTIGVTNYEYTLDSDGKCEVDIRSLLPIHAMETLTITDSGNVSDSVDVTTFAVIPPLFGMEHPSGLALCQPSDAVSGDIFWWMSRQDATVIIGGQTFYFDAGEYYHISYSSAWSANGRTYYAHTLQGCEDTILLGATGEEGGFSTMERSHWKIKDNTLNITDITNLDSVSALPRMSGAEESITLYKEGLNVYDIGFYSRLLQYDNAYIYPDPSNLTSYIHCRFSTKKSVIPNGNAGRFTLEIDVIVNVRKPL